MYNWLCCKVTGFFTHWPASQMWRKGFTQTLARVGSNCIGYYGLISGVTVSGVSISSMVRLGHHNVVRMDYDIEEKVKKEVVDLHQFFEDWFNGTIDEENKQNAFKTFTSRFDLSFSMDSPTSTGLDYQTIMNYIESSYQSTMNTGFKIEIKNVKVLNVSRDLKKDIIEKLNLSQENIDDTDKMLVFVAYEEWQENDIKDKNTMRQSHAVFIIDNENHSPSPNGLKWRRLHEQWL